MMLVKLKIGDEVKGNMKADVSAFFLTKPNFNGVRGRVVGVTGSVITVDFDGDTQPTRMMYRDQLAKIPRKRG